MWPSNHLASECIFFQSHSNCGHFSCQEHGVSHLSSPFVHSHFPVRKIFWINLRNSIVDLRRSFSNFPEKSPFSIFNRWLYRHWLVVTFKRVNQSLMIPGFFNTLWCDSCLIAEVSSAIFKLFTSVVFFGCLIKVVFNQVQKLFIIIWHDSWILKFQNSKFVERPSNIFAFLFPSFTFFNIFLDVNDRDFVSWLLCLLLHRVFLSK